MDGEAEGRAAAAADPRARRSSWTCAASTTSSSPRSRRWMETFVKGGERSLKARGEDEQAVHEREVRELRAKVGELVLELDARKKLDSPDRETRESLLTVQGLMRDGGEGGVDRAALPVVRRAAVDVLLPADDRRRRACRSSIARWSSDDSDDHRSEAGGRAADDHGAGPARAAPMPVNRKKIHRILKVNGWQVRQRPRGQRPRVQGWVSRADAAERTVGHRHDASLLRPRRLVSPDGDHRLLRPDDRRLAAVAVRDRARRGGGVGGRAA